MDLNFLSEQAKHTLQRQNTVISKQIFPEKEYRGSQSQFPYSCVCERFIYSHDWYAYAYAYRS
jgi:hypothetical protein